MLCISEAGKPTCEDVANSSRWYCVSAVCRCTWPWFWPVNQRHTKWMPSQGWHSVLFRFCISHTVWSHCLGVSTSLEHTWSSGPGFRVWFGVFSAASVWLWALCVFRGTGDAWAACGDLPWFRLTLLSPPSPASSCCSLVFCLFFAYDNTSIKMWLQMCQQGRRWESVGWWAGAVCPTSLPSFTSKNYNYSLE